MVLNHLKFEINPYIDDDYAITLTTDLTEMDDETFNAHVDNMSTDTISYVKLGLFLSAHYILNVM